MVTAYGIFDHASRSPYAWLVGAGLAVAVSAFYRWYRRRSPSARAGFRPRNRSRLVRVWRLWRADHCKHDSRWLRPLWRLAGWRLERDPGWTPPRGPGGDEGRGRSTRPDA